MSDRRLIVTADDVGLHRGMTEGAIQAAERGIVTACSVVANGSEIGPALERLARVKIDVGIHLTLVEECPVSRAEDVTSLVTGQGQFFSSYRQLAVRYFSGRIVMADVERELRAQIAKVMASGLTITHLNGHQHLHVLPAIFEVVLSLAREFGIGYVRIPADPVSGFSARSAAIRMLNHFGSRARKRVDRSEVVTCDRTLGIVQAGHLDLVSIRRLLGSVEGITELVCHPGIDRTAISSRYRWGYDWDAETEALCDPGLRAEIASRGIQLVAPGNL